MPYHIKRLDRPSILNTHRIDAGVVPAITAMNRNGIYLNADTMAKMHSDMMEAYDVALSGLREHTGIPDFNPGSSQQCARLIYDELGLMPEGGYVLTDKGAPSTADTVLSTMAHLEPSIIGKAGGPGKPGTGILECRRLKKLMGESGPDGLRSHINPDTGRVHTSLSLTVARTGRLASRTPNLQNQNEYIRMAFEAQHGRVLVSHDLSQIEMVWTAELTQDPTMIEIFCDGHDMHVRTACGVFGLDYAQVRPVWRQYDAGELVSGSDAYEWMSKFKKTQRLPSKTVGFAIIYGTQAPALRQQIITNGGPAMPLEDVMMLIENWFGMYPKVREWLDLQRSRGRVYGMVWTAFGRPRRIPESQSSVRWIVSAGDRQTGNTPVQGTAGDHFKIGIASVYHKVISKYRQYGYCEPILQIHDELITEVEDYMAEDYARETQIELQTVVRLSVPVKSSWSMDKIWGNLK